MKAMIPAQLPLRLTNGAWARGSVNVSGVAFEIGEAQLALLVGPNASGKSTMLRLLAGQVPLDEGMLEGEDVAFIEIAPNWRYVGDAFPSHPERGRAELARLGLEPDQSIAELSKGGRSRLRLAIAATRAEAVLLLDAPTTALDSEGRDVCISLIEELLKLGHAIVIATHDPELPFVFGHAAVYRLDADGLTLVRTHA